MTDVIPQSLDMRGYTSMMDRLVTELGTRFDLGFGRIEHRLDRGEETMRAVNERLSKIEGLQVGSAKEVEGLRAELKDARDTGRRADEKTQKLESRLVKLETIFVPAMGLASAISGALIEKFIK